MQSPWFSCQIPTQLYLAGWGPIISLSPNRMLELSGPARWPTVLATPSRKPHHTCSSLAGLAHPRHARTHTCQAGHVRPPGALHLLRDYRRDGGQLLGGIQSSLPAPTGTAPSSPTSVSSLISSGFFRHWLLIPNLGSCLNGNHLGGKLLLKM